MKTRFFGTLCLLFLLLLSPARAGEKTLSKAQKKKIVSSALRYLTYKYFPEKQSKRKEILEDLKEFEAFSWKGLRKAFRAPTAKPSLRPPKKKGQRVLQFPPAGMESCKYILNLPRGYTPAKAWPLALLLHGGGMNQGSGGQIMGLLGPSYQKRKCIVIAPTCPPDTKWCWPRGERFVMAILEEVAATYSVDPDRIYVAGHSFGGVGAWYFGIRFPDFFAGFGPAAGNPYMVIDYEFLYNTPFYVVHGVDDARVVPGPDLEAQKKIEALNPKPRFYKFVFGNFGHGFPHDHIEGMAKFLLSHKRDMYVKRAVCGVPFTQLEKQESLRSEYHMFWLGVDEHVAQGKAVGELAGDNLIRIRTENVSRLSIFVSDDYLDLQKPITVEVNGTKVFEKKVSRSAEFLLKHLAKTGDRGRIFANRIRIQ
ncbi:MAG: carboxylesterase family protein [Planctomycetota bacterium]|jgi:pimeloyl-ACP methyl ester carboxylesterase